MGPPPRVNRGRLHGDIPLGGHDVPSEFDHESVPADPESEIQDDRTGAEVGHLPPRVQHRGNLRLPGLSDPATSGLRLAAQFVHPLPHLGHLHPLDAARLEARNPSKLDHSDPGLPLTDHSLHPFSLHSELQSVPIRLQEDKVYQDDCQFS